MGRVSVAAYAPVLAATSSPGINSVRSHMPAPNRAMAHPDCPQSRVALSTPVAL